ncbi:MAG: hypothetical protein AUK48_04590 [Oscillatoriales cyanobacterium CG2_30_44_21]|nr:MAG: hypothetical protein AUK48_04590 [Oscillatoriales cyanobacterium CG2_30_44_21]
MVLKVGKIEIEYRLLISLGAIAIAYRYLGGELGSMLKFNKYFEATILLMIAVLAALAIPQSLGGLLAAIAMVVLVYLKTSFNAAAITALTCLAIYLLGFQEVRYQSDASKKLSLIEIAATLITVIFGAQAAWLILQYPSSWLLNMVIGAIAGAITLVGKQLSYTELPTKTIAIIFGTVTTSSLIVGLVVKLIGYALYPMPELY